MTDHYKVKSAPYKWSLRVHKFHRQRWPIHVLPVISMLQIIFTSYSVLNIVHWISYNNLEQHKGTKVPHMCHWGDWGPQVPNLLFALWLAKLQAIMRQVHQMTLITQGQMHPYVLLLSSSFKFPSPLLYHQQFSGTGHFEIRTLNHTKMTMNTTRSKFPNICHILMYPSHRYQSLSFCDTYPFSSNSSFWFSSYKSFWDKIIECYKISLNGARSSLTFATEGHNLKCEASRYLAMHSNRAPHGS